MAALNLDNIAALALNCDTLGVKQNLEHILKAAHEAKKEKKIALFTSELSVSGVECGHIFLAPNFTQYILHALKDLQAQLPEDFLLGLGVPYLDNNKVTKHYLILNRHEILFTHSLYIDKDIEFDELIKASIFHYQEQKILIVNGKLTQYLKALQHTNLEVDLIIYPQAQAFCEGKYHDRVQHRVNICKMLNAPLLSINNLGCDGGVKLYDGQCFFIDHKGNLLSNNAPFSFKTYDLVTNQHQIVPLMDDDSLALNAIALGLHNWLIKTYAQGYALSLSGGADSAMCASLFFLSQLKALCALGLEPYIELLQRLKLKNIDYQAFRELLFECNLNLETMENQDLELIKNALKQYIMPQLLFCAYQGSKQSSTTTFNAAKNIAQDVGATFYHWSIDPMVENYVNTFNQTVGHELNWQEDDLALQNIQARSRLPSIWLLANQKNCLLMATSNLSEASVGYCTMDGDTAGGISPIGGLAKSRILMIAQKLMTKGIDFGANNCSFMLPSMRYIVEQEPTAELRPGGSQTDEQDLMPYILLDHFRQRFLFEHMLLEDLLNAYKPSLNGKYAEFARALSLDDDKIELYARRFLHLMQRSQWKRERFAPSFSLGLDDVNNKELFTFPILSAPLNDIR